MLKWRQIASALYQLAYMDYIEKKKKVFLEHFTNMFSFKKVLYRFMTETETIVLIVRMTAEFMSIVGIL